MNWGCLVLLALGAAVYYFLTWTMAAERDNMRNPPPQPGILQRTPGQPDLNMPTPRFTPAPLPRIEPVKVPGR